MSRMLAAPKKRERVMISDSAKTVIRITSRVRIKGKIADSYDSFEDFCNDVLPMLYETFKFEEHGSYNGEDLAHSVIMLMVQPWEERKGQFDNLHNYVSTVATHLKTKMWRGEVLEADGRYYDKTILSDQMEDIFCDTQYAPDKGLSQIDARRDLKAAINGLHELDQNLIILHYWGEWPVKALAEKYGISPGNVKKRMSCARKELKGILERSKLSFLDYVEDADEDLQEYYNVIMDKNGQKPTRD